MLALLRRFSYWTFIVGIVAATAGSTHAQQARDVAERVLPSVAMLVMQDAHGEPVAIGSGFLVQPGILATNAHVIADAAGGVAVFTGDDTEHTLTGIMAFDAVHDIALLQVEGVQGQPLPLAGDTPVSIGETVYAAGSPHGMAGTFSNGIVSALRQVDDATLIQATAPISPGSSGGPLVNDQGQVVGITVALIAEGQNLNFAIAARHLADLMNAMHEPEPFADQRQAAGEASVLDQIGGPAATGIEMDSFLWEFADQVRREARGSFTVRNRYAQKVGLVSYQVLFYDTEDKLVESVRFDAERVRTAGLSDGELFGNLVRVERPLPPVEQFPVVEILRAIGIGPSEAHRLAVSCSYATYFLNSPDAEGRPHRPEGRVEFRVLDFELIDSDAP